MGFDCPARSESVPGHASRIDADGVGTVADQRLYQLVRHTGPVHEGLLEIEFLEPGAEVYCFTFG